MLQTITNANISAYAFGLVYEYISWSPIAECVHVSSAIMYDGLAEVGWILRKGF